MSIYRDKERGRFIFEFDRYIDGKRIRARKLLPKAWNQAQADAFERQQSARLYAVATKVQRAEYLIEDAVKVYLKDRVPILKSGSNIEHELAQIFWAYEGKPLSSLADACSEYRQKAMKADGTPLSAATLRNRIRYLTSACRYAWKIHNMCDHDPAERVTVPAVRNARQFYIDRQEMLLLCLATQHRATRAAIRIAFYSGMRMSEIRLAKREKNVFMIPDTKNGMPRHVPIHPKIRSAASVALPDQSTLSRHFRAARKARDMDWLHFHDLRHSAASQMINQRVDLYTVGAVLGHKSHASTQRYAHLATESLRDAITRIGQNFPHHKKTRAA
ncbi:site-specific integrase [Mycetohabitans rhizoxinica]|uniref:tyrosine-type recombinase/integrase n=1 Tax=Mycetohabitans TaxID=2571159 RepID=UPI001F15FCBB|nr:site-specific integrase [Mycetohabitans sp. B2]MCF7695326.1 site-specific integrase [Mycetohabitans sp. B2]